MSNIIFLSNNAKNNMTKNLNLKYRKTGTGIFYFCSNAYIILGTRTASVQHVYSVREYKERAKNHFDTIFL